MRERNNIKLRQSRSKYNHDGSTKGQGPISSCGQVGVVLPMLFVARANTHVHMQVVPIVIKLLFLVLFVHAIRDFKVIIKIKSKIQVGIHAIKSAETRDD